MFQSAQKCKLNNFLGLNPKRKGEGKAKVGQIDTLKILMGKPI